MKGAVAGTSDYICGRKSVKILLRCAQTISVELA